MWIKNKMKKYFEKVLTIKSKPGIVILVLEKETNSNKNFEKVVDKGSL